MLAVGGTALDANWGIDGHHVVAGAGSYLGEMAWNEDTDASGGGYSSLFPRPSYQDGVARIGATRGVPDVAANADSSTAMALDFSGGALLPASGTSAATPLWAAVIALADQQAGRHLGFVNPALYVIARGPDYQPGLPRRGHRRQLGALVHRRDHRLQRGSWLGPGHWLG